MNNIEENDYPIQYKIGNVNFYGYEIKVDERCLIPRFETEFLVEKTIKLIKQYQIPTNIIDICTGSGCIAITLSKELNTNVDALDISKNAIEIAKENTILNNANVNFINEDIKLFKTKEKYNILISNPPYVKEDEIVDPKTKYEPQIALFAKDNGLEFYKIILEKSKDILEDKSIIAFEIGDTLKDDIISLSKKYYPNAIIIAEKDLAGFNRYIFIINE